MLRRVTDDDALARRVRAAHADLAEREGRLRTATGGGALRLPGIGLMASGLPRPQWNNADVLASADVAAIDIGRVRRWFAERAVPWGCRVPLGFPWPYGRRLLTKRVMAAGLDDLAAAPRRQLDGVRIGTVGPDELDAFARVDAAAFGDEVGPTADFARPMVAASGFRCLLARDGGEPAGVAYGILTDGDGGGGTSLGIFGVGVLSDHRRRGIGAALTTDLLRWGADAGADLAWLNPDDDRAARLYTSLGFREVAGFDVYVDS
jgi:ribosomal protein S18 acetylase RimI-like enzyme